MMIENIPSTGPYGDARSLRITLGDGRIDVVNTLASPGNQLEVSRPVYGYEPHLAAEVERLRFALQKIADQRKSAEMTDDEIFEGEWPEGFDACVEVARAALRSR